MGGKLLSLEFCMEFLPKRTVALFLDRFPNFHHQLFQKMQVVHREECCSGHFVFDDKVADIYSAVVRACDTGAVFHQRFFAGFEFGVSEVVQTVFGPKTSVPGKTGRQDAVEHVYAPVYSFDDIFRTTDTHEVARFFRREKRTDRRERGVHIFFAFTHGESADGEPGERQIRHEFHRLNS